MYERYKGKLFSILGDSISTFEDMNPRYFPVYYQHELRLSNDVLTPADTWWHKVISHFGGKLLVNNSYSGGTVVLAPYVPMASGVYSPRIELLARDGTEPDVIMVFLGTNDLGYGMYAEKENPLQSFPTAYDVMIGRIRDRFPKAEIWCMTLLSRRSAYDSDRILGNFAEMERYNAVIRSVCCKRGCLTVDLFSYGIPYSCRDGLHPDKEGMETIARLCIDQTDKRNI